MVSIDREAPLRFLSTGYEADDWIAVFLKTYRTGDTAQRVVSVPDAASPRFQAWLRFRMQSTGTSMSASTQSGLGGPERGRPSKTFVTCFSRRTATGWDCWRR